MEVNIFNTKINQSCLALQRATFVGRLSSFQRFCFEGVSFAVLFSRVRSSTVITRGYSGHVKCMLLNLILQLSRVEAKLLETKEVTEKK